MGRIKSALEIAMEKTETVRGDKDSIGQFEARQQGKRLANGYLGGEVKSLEAEVKRAPAAERESLRRGIFEALLAQLALPQGEEDLGRLETVCRGLQTVIGDARFGNVSRQLTQLMRRYLGEAANFDEQIRRQYEPTLRQKEEEVSRRMGMPVRIDPFQDPEFASLYNQNMNQLKATYEGVVNQVRGEAERLFGGE